MERYQVAWDRMQIGMLDISRCGCGVEDLAAMVSTEIHLRPKGQIGMNIAVCLISTLCSSIRRRIVRVIVFMLWCFRHVCVKSEDAMKDRFESVDLGNFLFDGRAVLEGQE